MAIKKGNIIIKKEELNFVGELKQIVLSARRQAYSAINFSQVCANWLIGQRIVEQEQNGENRAEYGKQLIKLVSQELTNEFGNGFSETNIKSFRRFYSEFQDITIQQAVPAELRNRKSKKGQALPAKSFTQSVEVVKQALPAILSWTHYERLIRVTNREARDWYMKEASKQMWSYRTLDRNISTQYYERLLLSQVQVRKEVEKEMIQKTAAFQSDKLEFIKNPTVLEFLGLPKNRGYSENELESAIVNNLQQNINYICLQFKNCRKK